MNRSLPVAVVLALAISLLSAGARLSHGDDSATVAAATRDALKQERELGQIRFERDYTAARAKAKQKGVPLFVLFDEVPGCATCTNFGDRVLSDPLVVDAVELPFVPVLVRNNVEGPEREILKRFGEPTWANPSARVVDPGTERTLASLRGDYSRAGVLELCAKGLAAAGQEVPAWLDLHRTSGKQETLTFAMGCFWRGEQRLGRVDGVSQTRTGWLNRREVVEVTFDPTRVSATELTRRALDMRCADEVTCRTDGQAKELEGKVAKLTRSDEPIKATPGDDKYRIRRKGFAHLPMTEAQATRVNAHLGSPAVLAVLTPRQRELLKLIRAHPKAGWPDVLGVDYRTALPKAEAVARRLK